MSYIVIARRWRPNNFDDIVGQEHVTKTLKNAIIQKRIAHAFLFSGPRGTGKTSTARVLAKALNCEIGPTENPCQTCVSCKEISGGNSLDVFEIDGASNTSVEDVRNLRENIKFMPSHGKYKIYIIDEVHMLSRSAFNALLKTLEEPPDHVIFIFATTEVHKLPLTVISRCQRFEFKKISYKTIFETLKKIALAENINITDEALSIIARNGEGSLRDSETLLDQILASSINNITKETVIDIFGLNKQEIYYNFIENVIKNDLPGMFDIIDEIVKSGLELEQFLKGLLEYCRNLLISHITNDPSKILELSESEINQLSNQAKKFTNEDLSALIHIISFSEADLHNHNNSRYQLEFMCLKIFNYAKTLPISELAEKIMSLQNLPKDIPKNISKETLKATPKTIVEVPKQTLEIKEEKAEYKQEVKKSEEVVSRDFDNPAALIKHLEEETKKNSKIVLSTCFSEIKNIKFSNEICHLLFEHNSSYHGESIEKNKAFVEKILSEYFNIPIKIKIDYLPKTKNDEKKNIHKTTIVDKALVMFEGQLVMVGK